MRNHIVSVLVAAGWGEGREGRGEEGGGSGTGEREGGRGGGEGWE
jgi:hypothetical protein